MDTNFLKSKKAAMEMSVGTIVVIVLSMVVLVLGIFFIQQIFGVGTSAVDSVDAEVQSQIQKLFDEEGARVAIYPTSRRFSLDQGDNDRGFAFSIRNAREEASFRYEVTATDASDCTGLTEEGATGYILGGNDEIRIGEGSTFGPELVTFIIPEEAPLCSIVYRLTITRNGNSYESPNFVVTIR